MSARVITMSVLHIDPDCKRAIQRQTRAEWAAGGLTTADSAIHNRNRGWPSQQGDGVPP
jgi:hypothetical protein